MTIKNGAKKTFSLEELSEMMELLKNNKSNSSSEVDDSIEDEDDEPEDDSNSSSEVDDSIEDEDDEPEDDVSADDILEDEPEDDSNSSSEVDDSIEDEDEAPEENVSELNHKIDKLASDFKVFSNKIIPMLEALLAAQRIAIGIKGDETPRVTKEKRVLAKLNTASGKLKKEVVAVLLVINDEGVLKATSKSAYISKGRAIEEELEFEGKIPNGNWIVVEKSDKYYLVDVENFSNARDVTPYETESEDDKEFSNGIVVNKKGVANNCRGYKLENQDEDFKLSKRSLEKPFKVFNAKWTKTNCDYPIVGEAIPEGTWVIVEDEEGAFFLVESKDVEPTISTKKTEKKAVKKVVKTSKKTAKKVAKKNKKK